MPNEPFVYWRTIRFGDADPAGIVYTPRFGDYCLEDIEVWLNDLIDLNRAHINLVEGMGTPFVHMEFDFHAPDYANDRLGISVIVEKIGSSSLTVALEGIRIPPDRSVTETSFNAKFVMCFVRKDAGPTPIPEHNRRKLEDYLAMTN